jgi:hypothetical protein
MVLEAIKRTEPCARLAMPTEKVPVARHTLLEKSRPWWITLVHGFQKERNGGSWSYPAIFSSIVFILAMIRISPLSAALLTTKEAQISRPVRLNCLSAKAISALIPQAERDTYLRTTGAIFQNYSTSPWVTGEYFTSPFSPAEETDSIWKYRSRNPQSWAVETTVYRNDYVCSTLHVRSRESHEGPNRTAVISEPSTSVLLVSEDGCQLNFTLRAGNQKIGVDYFALRVGIRGLKIENGAVTSNDDCPMDDLILTSTPWFSKPNSQIVGYFETRSDIAIAAYACRSEHTLDILPVRASSTQTGLKVTFDENHFGKAHAPVPSNKFDLLSFRDTYQKAQWDKIIAQKNMFFVLEPPHFMGHAVLLGSRYNFSIANMGNDSKLFATAASMRRHFFAEILRTTLSNPAKAEVKPCSGARQTIERRVVANSQVASLLCTLFALSFCGLLVLI